MKKKWLILFICSLMLYLTMQTVSAQTDFSANALGCYNFNSTELGLSTTDSNHVLLNNEVAINTTGKLGNGALYCGFSSSADNWARNTTFANPENIRSICGWVYHTQTGGDDMSFTIGDGTADYLRSHTGAGNIMSIVNGVGGDTNWGQTNAITQDQWVHTCMLFGDNNQFEYWENGALADNQSGNSNRPDTDWVEFTFCNNMNEHADFNSNHAGWDEVIISSDYFTASEIAELYNGGAAMDPCLPGAPPPGLIDITNTTPFLNESYNVNLLEINATVNSTIDFNCSLIVNGTFNQTDNRSPEVASIFRWNLSFPGNIQQSFEYNVECMAKDGSTGDNSSFVTFYIDNLDPQVNSTVPSSNYTFNTFYQAFTTNILLSDGNLYSWYINMTTLDGSLVYNLSNTSLTGVTEINLTQFVNVTGTYGVLNFSLTLWDGHTLANMSSLEPVITDKIIKFTRGRNISIYDEYKLSVADLWTSKRDDRHEFGFNYSFSSLNRTYIVESEEFIDILNGKTRYLGHLVTGTRWIDFQNDNVKSVNVERISSKKVRVMVEFNKKVSSINYRSIGELNHQDFSTLIFMTNITTTDPDSTVISGTVQQYGLDVSYNSTHNSRDPGVNATFVYNGTIHMPTATNTSSIFSFRVNVTTSFVNTNSTVTYFWNFTTGNRVYQTGEKAQNITGIVFGVNCSADTAMILNITVYNESNNVRLASTVNAHFNYTLARATEDSLFNFNGTGADSYGICITPANAEVIYYMQLEFQDDTEFLAKKTYYLVNATGSNVTQALPLYLTGGTTQVKFIVHDQNDNAVKGAYIRVLSYDLGTSTSKVTEIVKSDDNGDAYAQIVKNTKWYQFQVFTENNLRLFADERKITSPNNEVIFRISNIVDYFANYDIAIGVVSDLTFNDVTNTFTFTFADTSGNVQTGCMEVKRLGNYGSVVENLTCVSSSSGSIDITTDTTTGEYFANGYIKINPTITLRSLSYLFNTPGLGTDGILLTIIIFITMVGAGAAHPAVGLIYAAAAIIFSVIAGWYVISFSSLLAILIITGIVIFKMRQQ